MVFLLWKIWSIVTSLLQFVLDGKYKCINCQILIQSPEKNFNDAWCYTFWETLFLGEGTDLQVTFIEMNYMSYVYYVEWMITKNGEAFKLLLPLILAIEITLWFDLFCFVLLKRNKEKKEKKYMYIYINIGSLCFDFSVTQCSIRRSRVQYILR